MMKIIHISFSFLYVFISSMLQFTFLFLEKNKNLKIVCGQTTNVYFIHFCKREQELTNLEKSSNIKLFTIVQLLRYVYEFFCAMFVCWQATETMYDRCMYINISYQFFFQFYFALTRMYFLYYLKDLRFTDALFLVSFHI